MPYHQTRDLTDYVTSYAPLLAVLVAVGVALMQYYLQRQHFTQTLFEKRLKVYSLIDEFLVNTYMNFLKLDIDTYLRLRSQFDQAKFLFGSEVTEYLQEFVSIVDTLGYAVGEDSPKRLPPASIMPLMQFPRHILLKQLALQRQKASPEDARRADVWMTLFGPMSERREVLFRPYLRLHNDQNWLVRLKNRLDRWIDGRDTAMASRYKQRPTV